MSEQRKALGYCRCSTSEQADSGLGMEAQKKRITDFCSARGLQLTTIISECESGGKPLASRPGGKQLLQSAKITKAVVVTAKLDRLFRSAGDAANTITDFDKRGIELVSIGENIDMTNAFGRAMLQIISVFAELERSMIRERTRSAMSVKRSSGQRISRYAPYGSDFAPDGKLLPNVLEQGAIAAMRRMRARKLSLHDIALRLDAMGVTPKRSKTWNPISVRAILKRTV